MPGRMSLPPEPADESTAAPREDDLGLPLGTGWRRMHEEHEEAATSDEDDRNGDLAGSDRDGEPKR